MRVINWRVSGTALGRPAREGESPVCENASALGAYLSRTGHEKSCLNPGGPPPKAKYEIATDSGQYREGTAKRTPGGE